MIPLTPFAAPTTRRCMALAALVLTACATAAGAQEIAVGPATYAVTVRHLDRHPRTPRAIRAALDRIGDAVLTACGASAFSLREVKASVRASPCWHAGMADAVARIGDPVLAAAFARDRVPRA